MNIIDIGCGRNKLKGSIGIDFSSFSDADIVLNLNKDPLPFEDSSIDFVYSSHCLEHLSLDGFMHIISEIYRVCNDSSQIFIKVPYFNGSINWANPFHNNKVCFNEHTFRFFSSENTTKCLPPKDYITPTCQSWGLRYSANHEINIELETSNIEMIYFPEYATKTDDEKSLSRRERNNVVEAIHYHLRPIKPCPQLLKNMPVPTPVDYTIKIKEMQAWHEDQIRYLETVSHITAKLKNPNNKSINEFQGVITTAFKAIDCLRGFNFSRRDELYITEGSNLLLPPDEVYRILFENNNHIQRLIEVIPRLDAILSKIAKWKLLLAYLKKYLTLK